MTLNYRTQELLNFIPNNDNPLKKVDQYNTKQDLMNQQIQLLYWESLAQKEWQKARNAQSYIDSYRKANDNANDNLWNRNMNTLKDLWVSMDDIRAAYYQKYPTPQMQWAEKLWNMIDNYMYNKLWTNKQETNIPKKWRKLRFAKPDNRIVF